MTAMIFVLFGARQVSYANDIRIRVQFHPQLLAEITTSGIDARRLVDALTSRARELVCQAYPSPQACAVSLKGLDGYSYTIPPGITELEESAEEFGENAVVRAFDSVPNRPINAQTPRTLFIVRDITWCCKMGDNACAARQRRLGLRWLGCTRLGRPAIVLALGPAPFSLDESPGGWLETTAWALAHEIGHTFGFDDVASANNPDPDPQTRVDRVPLMAAPLRPLQPDATGRRPTLTQQQQRRFENRPVPAQAAR